MFAVNNLWMLVATVLVFIMHLGFATLGAFAIFLPIKYTIGLRMPAEEVRGLDICEHGMDSYHGFQVFNNQ